MSFTCRLHPQAAMSTARRERERGAVLTMADAVATISPLVNQSTTKPVIAAEDRLAASERPTAISGFKGVPAKR